MRDELALAVLADELGYDSYWATEHHFFGYSMCPDNLQWLAQVASALRVGSSSARARSSCRGTIPTVSRRRSRCSTISPRGECCSASAVGSRGASTNASRSRWTKRAAASTRAHSSSLEALNKGYFEADTEFFSSPRVDLRPRPRAGFSDRLLRDRRVAAVGRAGRRARRAPDGAGAAAVGGLQGAGARPVHGALARAARQRAAADRRRSARLLRPRCGPRGGARRALREELLLDRGRALRDRRRALRLDEGLRVLLRMRRRADLPRSASTRWPTCTRA